MPYAHSTPAVPAPETVIWRYMDDWKFEDLLARFSEHEQWRPARPGTRTVYFNNPGQLWFGFPGSFGDDLEGTFPKLNEVPAEYCDRMAKLMGLSDEEAEERTERFMSADTGTLRDGVFFMAQMCGVSCWHASDLESNSMWNDFVSCKNGVAIRSTCKNVERALAYAHNSPARKASPSVCSVDYIDHTDYFLPADGFRGLLSLIQESWAHEKEVRFVAKSPPLAAIPLQITTALPLDPANWTDAVDAWVAGKARYLEEVVAKLKDAYAELRKAKTEGFHLPIALQDVLLEVALKPGCSPDYESKVRDQLDNAGLSHVNIQSSSL